MADSLLVNVLNGLAKLLEDEANIVLRQVLIVLLYLHDVVFQSQALDVLHDHHKLPLDLVVNEVINIHDVGVGKRLQQFILLLLNLNILFVMASDNLSCSELV